MALTLRALACVALALLGAGCSLLGTTSIRGGRAAYNDAIVATNNEQVLAMIVRLRYGESSGLLAVSSITSNLRFQTSAGAEFGFGPNSNYAGNLVPLSIGFAYEESPTISYTPVQGETYLRSLLAPLPLQLTVLLLGALRDSPHVMTLLLRSINGIPNPDFLADASVAVDDRFTRVVALLSELSRQGRASWVEVSGTPPTYVLALRGEGEAFAAQVGELCGLLGFEAPRPGDGVVTLPVQLGIGRSAEPVLRLATRSLFDVLNIAAASVDVPEEHLASGLAPPLPPLGPAGAAIHIRRSKRCPDDAVTAVRHHGWWYSIDGTDAASKLTFRVVESLISVRIADTVDPQKSTPVLTIPVAR